ncbi:MAG: tyrosine--tRNA ligase [Armatimonadetes bacterium]|nr:tyrosine--tRNA ligase [Armatimonadota bacterium]
MTVEKQLEILRRGTTEIISEDDLAEKLKLGRPLRIKLGVDPTAQDVTLGWAVVLRKLRDFQRLGHTACLIIGDFTAMIGDPSGKTKTRPELERDVIRTNVESIKKQLFKILDPEKTEILYNRDWLGKMDFEAVIKLCSRYTVARVLERDDFTNRLRDNKPISMHEILYPLCQGLDSVEIKADVELGGNDQKFNNLVGRDLQGQYDQQPQVVVLCPLLIGTDGKDKMSQSLDNFVSILAPPNDMFGKTMSIPDDLIESWFELCTDVPMADVRDMLAEGKNPRDAKMRLAKEIVAIYHDTSAADEAETYFVDTFSKGKQPVEAEEAAIPAEAINDEGQVGLAQLISTLGLAKSNGEARRLMKAGAVSIEREKVTDGFATFAPEDLKNKVLKVGKHQFRKIV